jgi:hypothetical protein
MLGQTTEVGEETNFLMASLALPITSVVEGLGRGGKCQDAWIQILAPPVAGWETTVESLHRLGPSSHL